jgi:hypothetical protein
MPSLEASLRNLKKAKANWRRPRRFRSARESFVIRRLVWQWLGYGGPKWPARALGRRVGVSHAYIQKLAREFAGDPSKIGRMAQGSIATFDELSRAQEETRKQEERGCLRGSRWKRAQLLRVPQDVPIWAMPSDSAGHLCEVRPWRHGGDGGWMY